jgi:pSer/pThr/pTyr-binding forkhead associated (FHA) protein
LNSCAFCGQSNAADSRFCVDCGKPLAGAPNAPPSMRAVARAPSHRRPSPSVMRRTGAEPAISIIPPTRASMPDALITCGWCGNSIEADLPFCPHCGRRTDATLTQAAACPTCGATVRPELDAFCASCGTPVASPEKKAGAPKKTLVFSAKRRDVSARLLVLDESGQPKQVVDVDQASMTIGRGPCEIAFPGDEYLSPRHAEFVLKDGALYVRDLGSANRTWIFLDEPYALQDDDVLLIGSQIFHFRRVASHGDSRTSDDGTKRIGSLFPQADIATLSQLRTDGTVRDVFHLAAKRVVTVGRDTGDWVFPYDQTMSGKHAEIRGAEGALVIEDLGSRNGIAVAVRGERLLRAGARLLAGDQVLRVEHV